MKGGRNYGRDLQLLWQKISFLDVGFDLIEIDKKDYKVCSACNGNFKQHAPDEKVVKEIRQQKQRIQRKSVAQENNPSYDDIHQIAGDLEFIKNLIIIERVVVSFWGLLACLV